MVGFRSMTKGDVLASVLLDLSSRILERQSKLREHVLRQRIRFR